MPNRKPEETPPPSRLIAVTELFAMLSESNMTVRLLIALNVVIGLGVLTMGIALLGRNKSRVLENIGLPTPARSEPRQAMPTTAWTMTTPTPLPSATPTPTAVFTPAEADVTPTVTPEVPVASPTTHPPFDPDTQPCESCHETFQSGQTQTDIMFYNWWLVDWEDDKAVCSITVNHQSPPTFTEIERSCGAKALVVWINSTPCLVEEDRTIGICSGYDLRIAAVWNAPKPGIVRSDGPSWWTMDSTTDQPSWLSTPQRLGDLSSDLPLTLLAGRLIAGGLVDAGDCPQGGLLPNGAANSCGDQAARGAVILWQNQFDLAIAVAATENNIPPIPLKRLFARESQFWPTDPPVGVTEYGLGHFSEMGADTLLMWNIAYYASFCPRYIEPEICWRGYTELTPTDQALLRGAVMARLRAECSTCDLGINLQVTEKGINVFANALVAYAEQVGQVIMNVTGKRPTEVSSVEDLWLFTVATYHAGAGCLYPALSLAWYQGDPLDWEHVSMRLVGHCAKVIPYVKYIYGAYSNPTLGALPWRALIQNFIQPDETVGQHRQPRSSRFHATHGWG